MRPCVIFRPLIVGLLALASGNAAYAGGESAVFGKLISTVSGVESTSVARYVLRESRAANQLFHAILGPEAGALSGEALAERAFARLQARGELRLAEQIQDRLRFIEDDFLRAMSAQPAADVDSLLGRLAEERLGLRADALSRGKVHFQSARVRPEDAALAKALASDVELNRVRNALEDVIARSPERGLGATAEGYRELLKNSMGIDRILLPRQVYSLLADEEAVYLADNLKGLVQELKTLPRMMSGEAKLRIALKRTLKGRVPADTIDGRIQALLAGSPDGLTRALGDMTLLEVQRLVHGGNPLAPTPDSLLGQYIQETHAATLVRTFDDAAGVEAGRLGAQGPAKLVVSVSAESFPVFMRIFKRPEWFSVVDHANLVHNAELTTYSGHHLGDLRFPETIDKPFPMMLLKTSEAQRMDQYLRLFRREGTRMGWENAASAPWRLQNYCARSYWGTSCTQQIGNIPIGDKRVIEYTMPGPQPTNGAPMLLNPPPVVQRIGFNPAQPPLMPDPRANDPLLARVWKSPGNQQLAEVIGQQGANLRGEMANPGWTISTLLGPTTVERVPAVFVMRPDHRAPVDPHFIPSHEPRR